ncbi:MAG: paraquat-inducible protein A [Desulfuromonadales bacterium]|nr:paraquat-inducible protein A [Desulfuromonadales bacterium]
MHQIACHECDLVQQIPPLPTRSTARCLRCGAVLLRSKSDSIDRTLAWTIAGLVLYAVATTFPFLAMKSGALVQHTALVSGVRSLYQQGETSLAILVFMTCILIPLIQMCGLLYVFIPLKMNLRVKYAIPVFRLFQHVKPWSMMEVYMLGILIAMVKLGKMATIVPGLAVVAFGLLIFALTFAASAVDARLVWERLGGKT